jgi:hypothetical protein
MVGPCANAVTADRRRAATTRGAHLTWGTGGIVLSVMMWMDVCVQWFEKSRRVVQTICPHVRRISFDHSAGQL